VKAMLEKTNSKNVYVGKNQLKKCIRWKKPTQKMYTLEKTNSKNVYVGSKPTQKINLQTSSIGIKRSCS
jgi:hypothetical protein